MLIAKPHTCCEQQHRVRERETGILNLHKNSRIDIHDALFACSLQQFINFNLFNQARNLFIFYRSILSLSTPAYEWKFSHAITPN